MVSSIVKTGPAIEYANGDKHWFSHGKRHRNNGPASEYTNKTKVWYINGNIHRHDRSCYHLS